MKLEQKIWNTDDKWNLKSSNLDNKTPQIVFCFGDRFSLENKERFIEIKMQYPNSHIVQVSTAGNIIDVTVNDHSIASTAVFFEHSNISLCRINIKDFPNSFEAGKTIVKQLPAENLRHALVFSDGHIVNGSELITGITSGLPNNVSLTGGLAGDDTRFEKTIVGLDTPPREGEIVLIGLYGDSLRLGYGSVGGWDSFGMERTITRSEGNVLYELDGKPVLELYKKYLKEYVKDLPGSALLFPLAIRKDDLSKPLVRTILSIDETKQTMTFAGDIPQGWRAQLMKANFDRLVDGAFQAAHNCHEMVGTDSPELALLISCVGRRIVLDQRVEDEIEGVREVIGPKPVLMGFYSYGEICPAAPHAGCDLHNQTMTITTISES